MTKAALRHGFSTLLRPHKTFEDIDSISLEKQVKHYLQLIIFMGIAAGVLTLLWSLGKAVYYDRFLGATVQYGRMLNYLAGKVFGVMFGYLMVGTFGMFLISIILNPFFRRMKYTRLLMLLFVAATPIIILGWIPHAATGVTIWAIVLFILGVKDAGTAKKVKKTSLQQRD